MALTATGIVHLLNNLFMGTLVRKLVVWAVVLRFGIPAIPAAILGAYILTYLDPRSSGIVIGVVLIIFALLEFQARVEIGFTFLPGHPRADLGGRARNG